MDDVVALGAVGDGAVAGVGRAPDRPVRELEALNAVARGAVGVPALHGEPVGAVLVGEHEVVAHARERQVGGVDAGFEDHGVVAAVPLLVIDGVGAVAQPEVVGVAPARAAQQVVARPAAVGVGVAPPVLAPVGAAQDVVAGAAGEGVALVAAIEDVIALAAEEGVDAVTADQGVVAGTAVEEVVAVVPVEGVVAAEAVDLVVTRPAVEDVRAAVAGDDVVQGVAGAVDVGGAGQVEVFNVVGERIGDRRLDRVGAFVDVLGDDVAHVVHDVGVVAGVARHGIGIETAVEGVVAVAAVEGVVTLAAGKGVDTVAADQGVVAAEAGEDVVAGVANYDVVKRVTSAVEVGRAGECEVFDVVGQGVGNGGLNVISAFIEALGHEVAGVIDDVGVAASVAGHAVRTGATIEAVVASAADQCIVTGISK